MEARILAQQRGHYKTDNLSLGAKKYGAIEFSDRQLEIMRAREERKANNNKSAGLQQMPQKSRLDKSSQQQRVVRKDPPAKILGEGQKISTTMNQYPEDELMGVRTATTAPTTTWESESAASSSSSFTEPTRQFYGQGLKGSAKKLYDDTGASFHESQSEASSASSGPPLIRKLASSATLEKQPSNGSDQSNLVSENSSLISTSSRSMGVSSSKRDRNKSAPKLEPPSSRMVKKPTSGSYTGKATSETSSFSGASGPPLKKQMKFSTTLGRSMSSSDESKQDRGSGTNQSTYEESSSAASGIPLKKQRTVSKSQSHSTSDEETKKVREPVSGENPSDERHSSNHLQSSSVDTIEDNSTKLKLAWKEKAMSKIASKSTTSFADDHQKTLLRNLMKPSYAARERISKTKTNDVVSASDDSSNVKTNSNRLSWSKKSKRSYVLSSARSASSSSSTSAEHIAIMKKVAARQNRKQLASNPRKQNIMKSTSKKMKQLLTPRSRTSDESANDERSPNEEDRRQRREEARLAMRGQAITPKETTLKPTARKTRRSPRNLVENSISRWSSKPTKSPKPPQTDQPIEASASATGDTASETLSSRSGEDTDLDPPNVGEPPKPQETGLASPDNDAQNFKDLSVENVNIKYHPIEAKNDHPQNLDIRKTSTSPDNSNIAAGMILSERTLKEQAQRIESNNRNPEIPGEDVEIKVSISSLSRKYAAPSPGIPNVETNRTTPLFSNKRGRNCEPEGYSEFLDILKREVAPSHSQMWRSFHSLIRGNDRYPNPLASPGCEDYSLDDRSKDMVTNMSAFIKRKHKVECKPGAQLANDKVVKGHATVNKLFGHRPRGKADLSKLDGDYESDKENSGSMIKQVASLDSIDAAYDNEFEVTLCQHVRKSMGGRGDVAPLLKAKQNLETSRRGAKGNNSIQSSEVKVSPKDPKGLESSQSVESSTSLKKAESSTATSSCETPMISECCLAPSGDSIYMNQSNDSEAKAAISPVPSSLSASKKRRHEPIRATESEASIPWSGVKLRTVMGSKSSDTSNTSIPPSWAKVKLRHVAVSEDQNNITATGSQPKQEDFVDAGEFHRIIVKKPSTERRKHAIRDKPLSGKNGIGKSASTPIEIIDVTDTATEIIDVTEIELPPPLPPRQTQVKTPTGESVPTNQSVASGEGSVIVSLCNDAESNSQSEMKVVIGKRGLMKVEAEPSASKARVIWRLDHDNLKSAMLDMSAHKVKLLLENAKGTKDLDFPDLDQCMRFANALHDMTNTVEEEDDEGEGEGELVKNTDLEDTSVFVEQLSEEEQQILEEFRQKKKNGIDPKLLRVDSTSDEPKPVSVVEKNNLSSPISEISGASSALSSDDSNVAEPYFKMLRLRVPKEAVRHKMEKDNVDPRIVAYVLGGESCSASECGSSASGNSLSIKEEKEAATYRKMLKMRVPPEAVRHKMEKEGVSTKIIHAVLGGEPENEKQPNNSSSPLPDTQLTEAEQSVADSYKKMLKMMVPKEAVEHKMKKDGVDEKIIVSVVGGTLKKQPTIEKSLSLLSDEEESVASSYRQMLKLKISREAVRHKMKLEGIADHIIANVLCEVPKHTPAKPVRKTQRVAKAGFHWNPVQSDEKFENSIWAKKNSLNEADAGEGTIDISKHVSEHVELFQKKPEGEPDASKKKKSNTETKVMAKLIDINRANNVAISLKAFKEFDNTQLAQIIEFVDPFAKITGDRALFMRDLLPVPAEVKVIKNYKGDEDRLVPAEKWFQQIAHIKRIDAKVRVMRTIETFKDEAEELGSSFRQLTMACKQVMESRKLPDLLELVRQIGNRMNQGRGEEAAGFKLDFLPRLAQTKGSDRKTTALDLVVTIFVAQNQRECLLLREELPDCQEASRIQIADLLSEVRNLQGARQKCEKELESLRKDVSKTTLKKSQPKTDPIMSGDSKSESAIPKEKPRKSMRSADTEVCTDVSSMHRELFEKRSQFISNVLKGCQTKQPEDAEKGEKNEATPNVKQLLGAVQSKTREREEKAISPRLSLQMSQKKHEIPYEDLGYTLNGAISRIEKFLQAVDDIFPKLEAERDLAIKTCKELSEFFCEPGGEKSAANLLNMLHEFSENIRMATKKYDDRQKMEARKQAQEQAKQNKKTQNKSLASKPIASSYSKPLRKSVGGKTEKQNSLVVASQGGSGDDKKSLVVMVNEMLKVAGDKGKEDFMKGITYSNPNDERLQRIYEAEKEREIVEGNPDTRSQMLAAIKSRSGCLRNAGTSSGKDIAGSTSNEDAAFSDEIPNTFSLEYSIDSSEGQKVKEIPVKAKPLAKTTKNTPVATKGRKQSIADRWTRKIDDDEVADDTMSRFVISNNRDEKPPMEDSDSTKHIQTVESIDTEDRKSENKTREAYMNRWARPANNAAIAAGASPRDLEEESDVGAVMEIKRRTRQRYINRWASKPNDSDGDSDSDLI